MINEDGEVVLQRSGGSKDEEFGGDKVSTGITNPKVHAEAYSPPRKS